MSNYFEYYKLDGKYGTKEYKDVLKIYNTKGNILYPDMNIKTVSKDFTSSSTKLQKSSFKGGYAGGVLIAVGAGILFRNTGKECDDCDTPEKLDRFKSSFNFTQQTGYAFIFLGGIFVSLGI